MAAFEWLSTGAVRDNGEPRGWKLHAVIGATEEMKAAQAWELASACGLSAREWGMDLFVEKKCARCLLATGLACPTCRGKGSHGKVSEGTWELCRDCGATGEKR